MPEIAQVRSIETLDAFRASLIVFHAKARPVLDEISSDLRRTQLWLESDRLRHWQREVIRRTRVLEAAQQALLSSRIATFRDVTPIEQNAVHAARRSLQEAEEHLRTVRRWIRDFGPRTEVLASQFGALDSVLSHDIPRAIAWLTQAVRLLEDYAERKATHPALMSASDVALPEFSSQPNAGSEPEPTP
jgi:hypothetical protein